ncbi:hypothetical protein F8M41_026190 [Gigaspora margarita]|uniref:Uncharacterized protein n=1 Tax=Gigaspora margarita TaxID=4874 RepID=A0A8H4AB95_GIGMA|nr:hypothetical protein F8M41_026190 [Gigaspora margarita]
MNCKNKTNCEKELEKALFTSIQSVSKMIGYYNNLKAQYDNLLAELVSLTSQIFTIRRQIRHANKLESLLFCLLSRVLFLDMGTALEEPTFCIICCLYRGNPWSIQIMVNVHTLQDTILKKGYRFGSIRELELKEALWNSIRTNSELSSEYKNLQVVCSKFKLDTLKFQIIRKDISLAEFIAKYATKLEEIKLLQNEIKLLKNKLRLSQKDSLKKGSEIESFKSKIVELVLKISKLEHLKSEYISEFIIGGDDEKNTQSKEQSSITKSDYIFAVSKFNKNLS